MQHPRLFWNLCQNLYQLFHDGQQLLHILDAGVAGSLVDDRGVYVRNYLFYASVQDGLHDLAEVVQVNAAGGLHDEVVSCASLSYGLHLILTLQSAHGEVLDGVAAHLLDHGDGGVYRNDSRLCALLGQRACGNLYIANLAAGSAHGVQMNLIGSQVCSGPAYGAERLVEVVRLNLFRNLCYGSPLCRVAAAQTYGKVAFQR